MAADVRGPQKLWKEPFRLQWARRNGEWERHKRKSAAVHGKVGNNYTFSLQCLHKSLKLHHHGKSLAVFPPHLSQTCINRAPPSQCRGGGIGGRCRGGYVTSNASTAWTMRGELIPSHVSLAATSFRRALSQHCRIIEPWPAHKVRTGTLFLFNWAGFSHNSNWFVTLNDSDWRMPWF